MVRNFHFLSSYKWITSISSPFTFKLNWIILINRSPIYQHTRILDGKIDEEQLKNETQCRKAMLEFDADLSLEGFVGDGMWESSYEESLCYHSYVTQSAT
jgi:hypothetical protein